MQRKLRLDIDSTGYNYQCKFIDLNLGTFSHGNIYQAIDECITDLASQYDYIVEKPRLGSYKYKMCVTELEIEVVHGDNFIGLSRYLLRLVQEYIRKCIINDLPCTLPLTYKG